MTAPNGQDAPLCAHLLAPTNEHIGTCVRNKFVGAMRDVYCYYGSFAGAFFLLIYSFTRLEDTV